MRRAIWISPLLVLGVVLGWPSEDPPPAPKVGAASLFAGMGAEEAEAADSEWQTVQRVIDGDTIVLEGGERVDR